MMRSSWAASSTFLRRCSPQKGCKAIKSWVSRSGVEREDITWAMRPNRAGSKPGDWVLPPVPPNIPKRAERSGAAGASPAGSCGGGGGPFPRPNPAASSPSWESICGSERSCSSRALRSSMVIPPIRGVVAGNACGLRKAAGGVGKAAAPRPAPAGGRVGGPPQGGHCPGEARATGRPPPGPCSNQGSGGACPAKSCCSSVRTCGDWSSCDRPSRSESRAFTFSRSAPRDCSRPSSRPFCSSSCSFTGSRPNLPAAMRSRMESCSGV